jgi:hypothetical protein
MMTSFIPEVGQLLLLSSRVLGQEAMKAFQDEIGIFEAL